MKINEAEQAIGITKKNIRFYEEQGLLNPSRNLSNGYRDYSPEDITVLRQIKLLRKLSIPIDEIKKLQSHHLTLEDCLRRHLITLDRESQNLDAVKLFCQKLLGENTSLENMDVEQLLNDMENMEEGGTRFMDIQKTDKKRLKKYALISAVVFIVYMLLLIGVMIWGAAVDKDAPVLIIAIFTGIPLICIIGILLALRERLKEIEGGELDEASKY